jgi:hypothetical protein
MFLMHLAYSQGICSHVVLPLEAGVFRRVCSFGLELDRKRGVWNVPVSENNKDKNIALVTSLSSKVAIVPKYDDRSMHVSDRHLAHVS